MFLYTQDKEKIRFEISDANKLGGEVYGNVYKISDTVCIKVYKNTNSVDRDVLEFLKSLKLKNYYKIYDFFYNKNAAFKAHTMKYYHPEKIDILTEPTLYTLNNLFYLLRSVETLNKNNILISDMHSENIIMNKTAITIIDTDLYTFNRFYNLIELELKNFDALRYLFESIYIEALKKYHPQYEINNGVEVIKDIFKLYTKHSVEDTFKKLEHYEYPIDYIKKRVKSK